MHFVGWLASLLPYLAREIFYPAALDEEVSDRANVRQEVLENSNFMNAFLERTGGPGLARVRREPESVAEDSSPIARRGSLNTLSLV